MCMSSYSVFTMNISSNKNVYHMRTWPECLKRKIKLENSNFLYPQVHQEEDTQKFMQKRYGLGTSSIAVIPKLRK